MTSSKHLALIKHWYRMARGTNYWTYPPGSEILYKPSSLTYYYIDLTRKTDWPGAVDEEGLPLVQEVGGKSFHHPMALAQKALGHWNRWEHSGKQLSAHRSAFLHLARWFCQAQDEQGGWVLENMKKSCYRSPYSAMAQGEAVSVLVRAYTVTRDDCFTASARRALTFMLKPVHDGGTSTIDSQTLVLEEYPQKTSNAVLNGWVSAIYGLHDYCLLDPDIRFIEALKKSIKTLIQYLPNYDAGYWSYYDLSGILASPYYHQVHITQLAALEKTFPEHQRAFRKSRETFIRYKQSRAKTIVAVLTKAYQKLRNPSSTVLVNP